MNGISSPVRMRAAVSRRRERRNRAAKNLLLVVTGLSIQAAGAWAQSAAPGASIQLEGIVVTSNSAGVTGTTRSEARAGSTAQETAQKRLDALPGAADVISSAQVVDKAGVKLSEQLPSIPGVIVQEFNGGNDQPRLQIRGSGLQQNPAERGVLILQDGLPINRADGSYIIGLADPKSAEFTEVYRGYTANRLGATVLGGAVNYASPTGISAPGGEVSVEAGSFGYFATHAQIGAAQGNLDGHASVSFSQKDGFRDFNESDRTNVNVNVGARIDSHISTRLFFGYTDLGFDITGPLPRTWMEADPTQVCTGMPACNGPNVPRDRPHRDAEQFRIGSRTTAVYGAHLFDLGLGYTYTDDSLRFPISEAVRDTEGGDFTTVMRYAYSPNASHPLPLFEMTGQYVTGSADREYYINNKSERGALFGKNELDASTLSVHAGFNVPLSGSLVLSPSLAYSYATRDNNDIYAGTTRPTLTYGVTPPTGSVPYADTGYERSYSAWSPSLGLTYDIIPNQKVFVALSRSFEPPTHDDLLAPKEGTAQRSPRGFAIPDLDAQKATTLEGGWKGREAGFAWSATTYYSWVDNELLRLSDENGVKLGAINADKTMHFGIELGLQRAFLEHWNGRIAYTFQNFRFDDDEKYGDNRIAGAPRNSVNAALRYTILPGLYVEGEVDWRLDRTPVDNANTVFNAPFAVFDLRANYDLNDKISVYGEVSNVFDKTYASSTLIMDTLSSPTQAVFNPGDGRAFIVGLKARY